MSDWSIFDKVLLPIQTANPIRGPFDKEDSHIEQSVDLHIEQDAVDSGMEFFQIEIFEGDIAV